MLSRIRGLSKQQVIDKLKELQIEHSENLTLDELRKILKKAVKKEITKEKDLSLVKSDTGAESDNESVIVSDSETDSDMAAEATKLEFCLDKGDWETFIERLENYFEAKDVPTAKQVPVLLMRLDDGAYKLIRDLCAPEKPKDKTLEQLKELFKEQLNPAPSEVMKRYNFHQARQEQSESVAEFAARLKKLSIHCNYKEQKKALRDQLVCGIKDFDTKVELFKVKELTFDDALTLAVAHERAVKNAAKSTYPTDEKQSKLFKLKSAQNNTGHARNQESKRREYKEGQADVTCSCCGKKNHRAANCIHRNKECKICHRKGHLAAVAEKRVKQR
ncbi:hypothetical protein TKK_0000427 [Trichogramma kaykai]|uniref:Retrotransposon gag domain-containing protein n=1 Tax=Trichogramma kaykai TaxID=54128 RepID=A0ABD2VXN0_9HYME